MKRERELPEYVGMVRRMIRALGRRVADADPEDLALMIEVREELDRAIKAAVKGQREQHDRSWTEIGRGLGIKRQTAQITYGRRAA